MTNQERPVGEEMDAATAAPVAVAEANDVTEAAEVVDQHVNQGVAADQAATPTAAVQEPEQVAEPAAEPAVATAAPVTPEAGTPAAAAFAETAASEPEIAATVAEATAETTAGDTPAANATSAAPVMAETEAAAAMPETVTPETVTPSDTVPATPEMVTPETVAPSDTAVAEAEPTVTETAKTEQAEALQESSAEAEGAAAETTASVPVVAHAESSAEAEGAGEAPASEPAAEGASYTPVPESDGGKPRRVKDLTPGMELEGKVTSIALYGIFVDIGVGRDGLVHISEMSDTRIETPSDVVKIGDPVKVRVKSIEPDGRRISLTMRSKEKADQPRGGGRGGRKRPELNREKIAQLKAGDVVDGTVTGIAPFGVFVDIGIGKDGLVHISELAEGRVEKAEDAVQVGQTYTFKILELDSEGSRISLSLRRASREQRLLQLEPGQIVEGTVSGIAPFGAFVDIGVGRDGLIHISELSNGRIEKVEDAVKAGDKVQVRVLGADPNTKRISLSLRLEDTPREQPMRSEGGMADSGGAGGAPEYRPRQFRAGPSQDWQPRENRERKPRNDRRDAPQVISSSSEEPEEPVGNATLDDLLSKYGGANKRNDRSKKRREDEEDLEQDVPGRRQRDAIRRTLGSDE